MAPVTEVMDPLMWKRDPRATSVNGDQRGRGAMRFGGREISLAKWEMEEIPGFKNLGKLRKDKDAGNDSDQVKQARREAQGRYSKQTQEDALGAGSAGLSSGISGSEQRTRAAGAAEAREAPAS